MLRDAPPSSLCLECEVCTAGCPDAAGGLDATQRKAMRERQCDLLSHPLSPVPRQCWHCAQAPCLEACPAGAMRRDGPSGLIWVDRSSCVGCWMCVLACPFGAVVPSFDGRFALKCDGCLGRDTPACAGSCDPRDALFLPALRAEAVRERRAGFALAGWGWPGPIEYPPPRVDPRTIPSPVTAAAPLRYVLVGGGIAAVSAAEAIRAADARGRIALVSEEATPHYSRVLLTHHIAGLKDTPSLALRSSDWADRIGVEVVAGDGALRIDVDRRRVALGTGREMVYDRLLIATGATAASLPVPGSDLEGVVALHDLPDAAEILSRRPEETVVVGGGLVGIKAAEALRRMGARVTVVEIRRQMLPGMLDRRAAQLVRERLEAHGVRVLVGTGVREIEGRGRATGVLLESGERLRGDLVVLAVGVTPRVAWLRGSRVRLHRGVLVDDRMHAGAPDVWAAGDVAESRDLLSGKRVVSGLWPVAAAQGRIAGANMAGGIERFAGYLPMNSLDLFGLALASFGRRNGDRYEVFDQGPDRYQRRVYQNGALVGATLVGDILEAGRLLAEGRRVPPGR